jgi:hypothetical protein
MTQRSTARPREAFAHQRMTVARIDRDASARDRSVAVFRTARNAAFIDGRAERTPRDHSVL